MVLRAVVPQITWPGRWLLAGELADVYIQPRNGQPQACRTSCSVEDGVHEPLTYFQSSKSILAIRRISLLSSSQCYHL